MVFFFIAGLCHLLQPNQESFELSEQSQISLLTCSPGNELYSMFGHCALRVCDPANRIDYVYNYGTFDYEDPAFLTNFIMGRLNYYLSKTSFSSFQWEYIASNRSIYEFELNMTHSHKQRLFQFLENNHLLANRYYLYQFFTDNCVTRLRDVLIKTTPPATKLNYILPTKKGPTFRKLIEPYLKSWPWTRLGINLLLGMPVDKNINTLQSMFLPDYLMNAIEYSTVTTDQYTGRLVKGKKIIFQEKPSEKVSWRLDRPIFVFGLLTLGIILITLFENKRKKRLCYLDFILFFITGMAGIVIGFFWFFTDHWICRNNLNILWLFPFNLVAAWGLIKKSPGSRWIRYYLSAAGLAIVAFFILIISGFQSVPADLLPLPVILLIRIFAFLSGTRTKPAR